MSGITVLAPAASAVTAVAETVGPLERMFGSVAEVGPMIAIGIPIVATVGIALMGKRPNIREAITIIAGLLLLQTNLSMVDIAKNFGTPEGTQVIEAARVVPQMPLAFHIEPLGMVYALIASSLWVLNSFYGIGYMRAHNEENQTRFFACFAIAISSAMGIAFAANMFTLFVFYEALTLSTFPLVAHYGTPEVRKSAHTYLGVLVVTSIGLLLVGIVGTYVYTGTLDFTPGGVFRKVLLQEEIRPEIIGTLFALYVFGIGKAAVMPVHRWLPAAMVAPTPVSAFLHAVAVVKAGVFAVLKMTVYIFGVDTLQEVSLAIIGGDWLVYLASFTILAASGIALYQDNLKRRLAYSTVSQLSYIVLGAALLTRDSITGGSLHMVMHAFGKITLFFCAGAIYVAHNKKNISDMRGLGRKMPLTFLAFLLASLSIIGLPPFGGAWSKWWLVLGSIDAGQQWVIIVLIVSSLLNIAYLIPVAVDAFWYPPDDADDADDANDADDGADPEGVHPHDDHGDHHHTFWLERFGLQEAPALCVIPLCITAVATIVLFLAPDYFLELINAIQLR